MGRRGLSGGEEMKLAAVCLALLMLPAAVSAAGAERKPDAPVLVHVQTLLDSSSDRVRLAARNIADALSRGRKVVVVFDGDGVLSLKVGRWFGGHSTPIDRIDITPEERRHLAGILGTTPDGVPEIYGSLLHFFRGRGVLVYASGQALRNKGLWPDRYDRAAEAVAEDQIHELLRGASIRFSY